MGDIIGHNFQIFRPRSINDHSLNLFTVSNSSLCKPVDVSCVTAVYVSGDASNTGQI